MGAGIRQLIFPSSIKNIGSSVFEHCENLELADLKAATRLKSLGEGALSACEKLGACCRETASEKLAALASCAAE